MKKTLLVAMTLTILVAASSVQAALNLVSDPNFSGAETGSLSFTTTPWAGSASGVAINNSMPIAGSTQNAVLSSGTFMFQNIAGITAATGYTVNLWLADPTGTGTLTVTLGGSSATLLSIPMGSTYVDYNFTETPITTGGSLFLSFSGTPLDVGQASVAVPEPTTMVAGALMLLPFAASTLRLRKKTSA